jgi:uncharacterized SAM-binding protein YcdF (DUF218 family)
MRLLVHHFFLNPAFWMFLFLIGASVRQYKKSLWLSIIFFLFASMFFDNPITYFVEKEERKFLNSPKDLANASYIVVLGSGGVPDYDLSPTQRLSGTSLWRCTQGLEVWKEIPQAKLIFFSSGREGYISQAEIYRNAVKTWGVPDSIMHVLKNGRNTNEEALDFKMAFPESHSLVLVTSALHMSRAKKIFEKYNLEVIPIATDFKVKRHPAGERWYWIPSFNSVTLWQSYLKEKIGILLVDFE